MIGIAKICRPPISSNDPHRMLKLREISRFRAAALHLLISAAIAFAVLGGMLALWYPPPYFRAMGGMELIALIVGVDVTLGPLLTLIVFDPRKKSLPFDLLVIATVQLAALGYGVNAMQAGRPVFTVFTGERFAVLTAAEIEAEELAKASREEFRSLSLTGPRLVAVDAPSDTAERDKILFAGLLGYGIQHLPRYYVPYARHKDDVIKAARSLDDLKRGGEDSAKQLARVVADLERSGRKPDSVRYLPVGTRQGNMLGVIDAGSGELLDIL